LTCRVGKLEKYLHLRPLRRSPGWCIEFGRVGGAERYAVCGFAAGFFKRFPDAALHAS
jgi:hypothetical protein